MPYRTGVFSDAKLRLWSFFLFDTVTPMPSSSFQSVFKALRPLLKRHERTLRVNADTPENYSLDTPHTEQDERALFFGAVQIQKNYVSYHLMPVYMYPDLLDDLSPSLAKQMHGKSCFNFKTILPDHIEELTELTQRCIDRLIAEGIVTSAS